MRERCFELFKITPILFICSFSFTQTEESNPKWSEYNLVNLSYQHSGVDFLSLQFGKIRTHKLYNAIDANVRLGYSLKDDYFDLGLNAHYNFFYFLSIGSSFDYYPSIGKQGVFSIRPEIGINPFGLFSIYYGFSLDSDQNNHVIQNHNLMVSIQLCSFDKKEAIWLPLFRLKSPAK